MTRDQLFGALATGTEIQVKGVRGVVTAVGLESGLGADGLAHHFLVTIRKGPACWAVYVRTID